MTNDNRPHPVLSRLLAPATRYRPQTLSRVVTGRTVLITGASFGIGRALALRLGKAGANVILAARSLDELNLLAAEISAQRGCASAFSLDLKSSQSIDAFVQALKNNDVTIDIVIHNAGKSIARSIAHSLDRAHDFHRTMAVNYLGPVQLQLALLPGMLERGCGHIISVSTLAVKLPPAPRWAAYTASKGAFDIWMQSAGAELRHRGIRLTSVYLGLVHTRMSAPTPSYSKMPGQTADEAASSICRALVKRNNAIAPWWLWPLRLMSPWLETPARWIQSRRQFQDRAIKTKAERAE